MAGTSPAMTALMFQDQLRADGIPPMKTQPCSPGPSSPPRTSPAATTLRLMRRGDEFSIRLGANELMNSRLGGSEEALATLACRKLAGRESARRPDRRARHGLHAARRARGAGTDAAIEVAELVPEVIAWGRGPMAELFADSPGRSARRDRRARRRRADPRRAQPLRRHPARRRQRPGWTVPRRQRPALRRRRPCGHPRRFARRRRAGGVVVRAGRRVHPATAPERLCRRTRSRCAPSASAAARGI